jgi:hypothetical protein
MTRVRVLGRLLAELRAAPGEHDARDALARLEVSRSGDVATVAPRVGSSGGEDLSMLAERSASVVELARNVYARIPTREGRVTLLALARRAARERVVVHVVVTDDQTHLGRLAFDAPRRVLRAIGARVAEPGDRFDAQRYVHCFFDEESLLDELSGAGLEIERRDGFTFTLRPAERGPGTPPERAEPLAKELARVIRLVREVDARRASETPETVLAGMRARGRTAVQRGPIGRARLQRAIGWVDAFVPGGASCYRRVLLETALDAGAARETVVFGLDVGSTGHVAFEGREERTFDVAFAIPATRP